jgi:PKD repeat protein
MKDWLSGKTKLFQISALSFVITLSIFTSTLSPSHAQTACQDVDNGFTGSGYGIISKEVTLTPLTGLNQGCELTGFTFDNQVPTSCVPSMVAVVYSDDGSGNPKNLLFQGTQNIDTTVSNPSILVSIPGGVPVDSTGKLWVGFFTSNTPCSPVVTAGVTTSASFTVFNVSTPPNPFSGSSHQGFHAVGHFTSLDDTTPATVGSIATSFSPNLANVEFNATATFTDDSDDTHTASWNWGDSTISTGTIVESGGSGYVNDTHTFTTAGTYTVTLTVNNSDGTARTSTQTITILTPAQGIQQLINLKESMNLNQGLSNSLDVKLNAALNSVNSGHNSTAKNQLNAFIHEVNAQTGKKITQDQSNQLVGAASNIITSLS